MHVRSQVLKDIRADGFSYSVNGNDTVGKNARLLVSKATPPYRRSTTPA